MADATQKEEPWWASFPEAKAACERIEASTVKGMILADKDSGKGAARDFLLVDVRRTDYEGGTIATSINLPAQSFYQTRPVTHQLCKQAGIKKIIFYCGRVSPFPSCADYPSHIIKAARVAVAQGQPTGCRTTLMRSANRTSKPSYSPAESKDGSKRTMGTSWTFTTKRSGSNRPANSLGFALLRWVYHSRGVAQLVS